MRNDKHRLGMKAKILERLHNVSAISKKQKALREAAELEEQRALLAEATASLKQRKLSRTPTTFEEASDIDGMAATIELQEEELATTLDALHKQQSELFVQAIVDTAASGHKGVMGITVPLVKEIASAYEKSLLDAVKSGEGQILQQLRLSKTQTLDPKMYKAVAKTLGQLYAEKRAADLRFDVLKAFIVSAATALTEAPEVTEGE